MVSQVEPATELQAPLSTLAVELSARLEIEAKFDFLAIGIFRGIGDELETGWQGIWISVSVFGRGHLLRNKRLFSCPILVGSTSSCA